MVGTRHPQLDHSQSVSRVFSFDKHSFCKVFTSGLADHLMNVPVVEEGCVPHCQRVELYMDLPEQWGYQNLDDRHWSWPIDCLHSFARHIVESGNWVGRCPYFFDVGSPFIPGQAFTGLLALQKFGYKSHSGEGVGFVQVLPVYEKEIEFHRKHGDNALFERMNKASVPQHVDIDRPCFV